MTAELKSIMLTCRIQNAAVLDTLPSFVRGVHAKKSSDAPTIPLSVHFRVLQFPLDTPIALRVQRLAASLAQQLNLPLDDLSPP